MNTTIAPAIRTDEWRTRLRNGRGAIKQAFLAGTSIRSLLSRNKLLVDSVLQELWTSLDLPASAALVAVGGYGRGELFPYSDVDLLILLAHPALPDEQSAIERLVGLFWDIGLEVGPSVRTLDECLIEAERDITIGTNLLESRFLTGNQPLYQSFRQRFTQQLDPRTFFEGKLLEQDQRHARFNDSAYQLEPNLKESPGGLRDLHNLRWLTQAAGIGASWHDLVVAGLLNPDESRQIQKLEHFLFDLRTRLHYLAGRREDRLLFDYQQSLAEQYQIRATSTRRSSEILMQRYYRSVKIVAQMRDILLPSLRARIFGNNQLPIISLNPRFQIRDNLLKVMDDSLFERQPSAIFESFILLQQHPELTGMSASTLRALWRARRRIDADFRRDPVNHAQFMQILRTPQRVTRTLRNMNHYGILGRYIPAFGRIVGQMQHDLYHIYTVDEHMLTVLRNLRRLTIPELSHEHPLASRLISGFARPELLYIAALFHDIAKGRGGDHSTLGMADARRFCKQHELSRADAELVVWLVGEHLVFSSTAQKQDLSDPDVIARFTQRIPDERHLTALYLLTTCDIRGTSPTVWNAWKAKLLEDLFYASRSRLSGDTSLHSGIDKVKTEASRLLRLYGLSPHTEDALWHNLADSYFLRHEAQEIAWHTRHLWHRASTSTAVVRARLSPIGEGVQVMIYAPDEASLFAQICAFFEAINYTIADAKVHTTHNGYALDSFLILDKNQRTVAYRDFLSYIEHELAKLLNSHVMLKTVTRGRVSRHLKHFPINAEVNLRPDERGKLYTLNLTAGDRPGLLSAIAQVLYQHNINLCCAKISTLGERAEDTFMIEGSELNQPQSRLQLETDLLRILNI
ncbi:MAG: [protein-PII] uridylyltransferase [Sulfuriferula sp.]|nr:[protein-PII] uridylyltransferase [Sulfuriferula sp.]